jgi:8-oxo-dGTP pyrophosphatase MutT (NUDIX family)
MPGIGPDAAGLAAPATPIRDAATIILLRRRDGVPQVLMGQRGSAAAFMPDKFVFPGGAIDPDDAAVSEETPEDAATLQRLALETRPEVARALPYTAVREMWEETGLRLGRPDPAAAGRPVPPGWGAFFRSGVVPDVRLLRFVFRAVTPPGRPRRFDARFFLLDADDAGAGHDMDWVGDGELNHVQWLAIPEARALPLPFITEVVLSELEARLRAPDAPWPVPFFKHGADGAHFRLL